MTEPYSPLRYPGGKAKLADFLIGVLDWNDLRDMQYAEPYAGGAGAALRLLFEEYVDSIIINDADPRIWAMWRAIIEQTNRFIEKLHATDATVKEWLHQREIYQRKDMRQIFDLGFATFFLNRTTRSGIIHNGGPIGGYDQTGNYKINARYNPDKLAHRVLRIGAYGDRIEASCYDGLALLKRLNRRYRVARKLFVYLDPPYYDKGPDLYLNRLSHIEHAKLAAYMSQKKNFPWVLTYDNVLAVRELYAAMPHFAFSLNYSAYRQRKGEELLIHSTSIEIQDDTKRKLPQVA